MVILKMHVHTQGYVHEQGACSPHFRDASEVFPHSHSCEAMNVLRLLYVHE
jgi:hypothetical protein